VPAGSVSLLTVAVSAGTQPPSTGIRVSANLAAIGGSATQTFYDDGTHGDAVAGDGTFSFAATVASATAPGLKLFLATIDDDQERSGNATIALSVPETGAPTASGLATPSTVAQGGATTLLVAVTPGTNPASTGLAVSADLGAIGGSAAQTFYDDGTHGDAVAGDHVFTFATTIAADAATGSHVLPVSITDAQQRSGTASIALTVTEAVSNDSIFENGFD
jgi:hypothetical protein